MRAVQSSEVKAKLPEFLDEVERGEVIVITRHGKPVAHLVPAPDVSPGQDLFDRRMLCGLSTNGVLLFRRSSGLNCAMCC